MAPKTKKSSKSKKDKEKHKANTGKKATKDSKVSNTDGDKDNETLWYKEVNDPTIEYWPCDFEGVIVDRALTDVPEEMAEEMITRVGDALNDFQKYPRCFGQRQTSEELIAALLCNGVSLSLTMS
jgi:hypothetical protein